MTKFIQLHALTVYAPSNLNRDDTGRPKTAKFGGAERLRISSQALKRAIRTSANFRERLAGNLGERTQRLGDVISAHLKKSGVEDAKALEITRIVAGVFGKIEDAKDKPQTYIKQLAFISPEERIAALDLADKLAAEGADGVKKDELADKLLRRADTAADIAMFGRMLADNPDYNREAAVQVAHADHHAQGRCRRRFLHRGRRSEEIRRRRRRGLHRRTRLRLGRLLPLCLHRPRAAREESRRGRRRSPEGHRGVHRRLRYGETQRQAEQLRGPCARQLSARREGQPAAAQPRRRVLQTRPGRKICSTPPSPCSKARKA